MCDEYDFAKERVSRYPEIWKDVYYAYLSKRYGGCVWTLRKLVPELRQKLRDRMYDDFSSFLKTAVRWTESGERNIQITDSCVCC